MKKFNSDELSLFDGKKDHPIYIGYMGKVYDVTKSDLWNKGFHMNRHHAGRDLTTDIQAAPHGLEVLERYPQVGILQKDNHLQREIPKFLSIIIDRFPMLKRHPHPMTVHFPIVFIVSATIFNILYLIFGHKSFEVTAFHCLVGGIISTPVAILTGFYTWWLNYMSKPIRAVIIKRWASVILLTIELIAFIWRLTVPDILYSFGAGSIVYLLLVFSLFPIVSIIGWFGAELTFPIEKD